MNSPQHTGDEVGVEAFYFSGKIDAKDGQRVYLIQQTYGNNFWDARGIIDTDYLKKGIIINCDYYLLSPP